MLLLLVQLRVETTLLLLKLAIGGAQRFHFVYNVVVLEVMLLLVYLLLLSYIILQLAFGAIGAVARILSFL